MAKNAVRTSKPIASKASKLMKSSSSAKVRSVAASAVANRKRTGKK